MTNINDGIDDYFNNKFISNPSTNLRVRPQLAELIAEWDNLDQMGRAELTGYEAGVLEERDRIIRLLSVNIGHVDFDDLVAMIEEEDELG